MTLRPTRRIEQTRYLKPQAGDRVIILRNDHYFPWESDAEWNHDQGLVGVVLRPSFFSSKKYLVRYTRDFSGNEVVTRTFHYLALRVIEDERL